uniref:Reverse transcriptase domain-containing protein n=2 Tax=Amphimedon queenslandica TaxID=400682 RepID=A0A1X7T5A2_AMPQE
SSDLLCSQTDIIKIISDLPVQTSPGPDHITSLLLKSTAHSISFPLQHIFNLSISTGIFPSQWKLSLVTPIPKTNPPSSSPTDYRPISLLSLVSKVLERHIFSILLDHLFSNNLISDSQFGFLPQRSTTSALINVSHHILSHLDCSTAVCGVFLDVKKAFDS